MVSLAVVPGDGPDTIRTKKLFATAMWASLVAAPASMLLLMRYDAPWAALTTGIPLVTAAASLVLMQARPASYPAVMHLVAGGTIVTASTLLVMFGGIFESGGAVSWSLLAVFGAVAVFADRRAHFWLAVFAASTAGAAVIAARTERLYAIPSPEALAVFNLVGTSLFIYVIVYYFVRKSDTLFRETNRLLHSILPDQVVARLKSSEELIADEFESASILFADVSGFTPMAAGMAPRDVVDLLNQMFLTFDGLVESFGLEKIKTIGDAYMAASGVPIARDDHARAICELALAMQERLQAETFGGQRMVMRFGVASGPVTAGVIGRKRFGYDMWGDTVNLASRMESTGVPGRIQITGATRDLVAPWFECERRGVIEVKGKGPVETWFLLGASRGHDMTGTVSDG